MSIFQLKMDFLSANSRFAVQNDGTYLPRITRETCTRIFGPRKKSQLLQALGDAQSRYIVFHRFRQAKFDYGGSILSSSQFLILPQLPKKVELTFKVVKVDSKIIILLLEI
jgi:hypothetical protein